MDDKHVRRTKGFSALPAEIKATPLSVEDRRVLDAILNKDVHNDLKGVSPKYLDRVKGKIQSLRKKIFRVCRNR